MARVTFAVERVSDKIGVERRGRPRFVERGILDFGLVWLVGIATFCLSSHRVALRLREIIVVRLLVYAKWKVW